MNMNNNITIQDLQTPGIGWLIRHADRDPIPEGSFGDEVPLNPRGVENAIALGVRLQNIPIPKIYTSPVKRCIQTAECICKGYGRTIAIIPSNELGDPGMHISNAEIAGQHFLQRGILSILKDYSVGITCPGFESHEALKTKALSHFRSCLSNEGLTLFISHDSFIYMYDFVTNEKIYTEENWINYLNGPIVE
jgi:broad specificity phosphatase PhoE